MDFFVADPGWGWWIIFYFFLGGLAAGCYFVAALIELCGQEQDRPLARIGYRVAFPLIVICGVLLILDLERPERFWHMVLQSEIVDRALEEGWPLGGWETMAHALMLKWWSPMSVGAQALGLFAVCSFLSFLGSLRPAGRLAHLLGSHWVGGIFKLVGCTVGFFIASYTGALLTATNQPLWSVSEWISPLFLCSAASTGVALLLLLGGRVSPASRERLELADLWALGLELFVFLLFLASVAGLLPFALATVEGLILVLGTLVVGLLLPLWLHLGFKQSGVARMNIAAACALGGGFLLRYGMVRVAPALLRAFPNPAPDELDTPPWQLWAGQALLGVTLVLALLIPYLLTRRWHYTPGQTALAGLVSLCVLAGVVYYSFNPPSLRSELLSNVHLSPESDRLRGGGPGASDINRPVHPITKSKIVEAVAQ